jgi:phytoene synthase
VRVPATVVYAFCLLVDQEVERNEARPEVAQELSMRLEAAYRGEPFDHAVDRAFSGVVRAHEIPRVVFEAMLEGFAWDAAGRRYATLDALLDYCVRVAGSFGVCMSALMDRRTREALERACDLGIAIELTSIARDVGEDARRGRVYLPIEWLEDAGVDVDTWLTHPRATRELRGVVRRLLSTADAHYLRADPGIGGLPFDCRPAVRAARYIYSAVSDEIERSDFDSVTRRVTVSSSRKARLIARALRPSRNERRNLAQAPLPAARFLLDAVTR